MNSEERKVKDDCGMVNEDLTGRELPILFNGDMVRAILDGRKTQTRRPLKNPVAGYDPINVGGNKWEFNDDDFPHAGHFHTSPYQVGDLLYVREAMVINGYLDMYYTADSIAVNDGDQEWIYRDPEYKGGIPSIHMPKWAARIWLRVTGVRVERVQDIKSGDALKEGVAIPKKDGYPCPDLDPNWPDSLTGKPRGDHPCVLYPSCSCGEREARSSFCRVWKSCYGNWGDNPWIWVFEFEVVSVTGRTRTDTDGMDGFGADQLSNHGGTGK